MSLVCWDSMLFIYWLEWHPQHGPSIDNIHKRMAHRGDQLCTGVFTVGEVLTGACKVGSTEKTRQLTAFFSSGVVRILPFEFEAAERYAQIRATHSVSPADAIQLATASVAQVDLYLTNDRKLKNLVIDGIKFIAGLDGVVF